MSLRPPAAGDQDGGVYTVIHEVHEIPDLLSSAATADGVYTVIDEPTPMPGADPAPSPFQSPAPTPASTTSGTTQLALTSREWQEQLSRFQGVLRRLNAGHGMGVVQYVQTFGRLGSLNEGFGDAVFAGMIRIWQTYPFQYRMGHLQSLRVGWFLLPEPFSRAAALMEPMPLGERRTRAQWYPAFFSESWDVQYLEMACLHILIVGCRPWRVHRDRMFSSVPIMAIMMERAS